MLMTTGASAKNYAAGEKFSIGVRLPLHYAEIPTDYFRPSRRIRGPQHGPVPARLQLLLADPAAEGDVFRLPALPLSRTSFPRRDEAVALLLRFVLLRRLPALALDLPAFGLLLELDRHRGLDVQGEADLRSFLRLLLSFADTLAVGFFDTANFLRLGRPWSVSVSGWPRLTLPRIGAGAREHVDVLRPHVTGVEADRVVALGVEGQAVAVIAERRPVANPVRNIPASPKAGGPVRRRLGRRADEHRFMVGPARARYQVRGGR